MIDNVETVTFATPQGFKHWCEYYKDRIISTWRRDGYVFARVRTQQ